MNENKVKKIRVLSLYGRSDNRRGFIDHLVFLIEVVDRVLVCVDDGWRGCGVYSLWRLLATVHPT